MAGQDRQPNDEMLRKMMQQHRLREQRRIILQQPAEPCPRCGSADTKFAYFNNMKETQPRYFCKGCRKLWTKGGRVRNVSARASSSASGIMLRPAVTTQSFLVGSAGRPHYTAETRPQAPVAYNIQPPSNVVPNALNPFTAAWQAPNEERRQLQPFMDNNMGGCFFAGPSCIDWSGHFQGNGPLN